MSNTFLPGMTECDEKIVQKIVPYKSLNLEPISKRKIILLATAAINDTNVFANGLFQNVFVLYKMFDAMGYLVMLLVNDKPKTLNNVPKMLHSCRMIVAEELLKEPLPVKAYIEIGMSIDPIVRRFLRMIGSKSYKLYLGNILNIDIETPMFYHMTNFAHHIIGELDEVWVSPHYKQHAEYACYLNHTDPLKQRNLTVPYVWDSCFIDNTEKNLKWRQRTNNEIETFVITEPNISFQKSSIIPILALERMYRQDKNREFQIIVINGERLLQTPYFKECIYDTLDIVKDKKITMCPRSDIQRTLEIYPYATFILHQINNEYNYMALELLHNSYPVIHNAKSWKEFGYYYEESNLDSMIEQFNLTQKHKTMLETYTTHAKCLIWTHSPHNPEVQKVWNEII
jgi:hypothetical protein